jgi:hypothetical protein
VEQLPQRERLQELMVHHFQRLWLDQVQQARVKPQEEEPPRPRDLPEYPKIRIVVNHVRLLS